MNIFFKLFIRFVSKTSISLQLSIASVETDTQSRRNSNDSCSDEDKLRMTETDPKSEENGVDEFKDKILDTKLNEENKENNLPSQRKLLRGQSQVVLPVKVE